MFESVQRCIRACVIQTVRPDPNNLRLVRAMATAGVLIVVFVVMLVFGIGYTVFMLLPETTNHYLLKVFLIAGGTLLGMRVLMLFLAALIRRMVSFSVSQVNLHDNEQAIQRAASRRAQLLEKVESRPLTDQDSLPKM